MHRETLSRLHHAATITPFLKRDTRKAAVSDQIGFARPVVLGAMALEE
jgi:hypothetical protein